MLWALAWMGGACAGLVLGYWWGSRRRGLSAEALLLERGAGYLLPYDRPALGVVLPACEHVGIPGYLTREDIDRRWEALRHYDFGDDEGDDLMGGGNVFKDEED